MTNKYYIIYLLLMLCAMSGLQAQTLAYEIPIAEPPTIPLTECKHRLLQSYDNDVYLSFVKYGHTQQNMYYYLYIGTYYTYNTCVLYYPATDIVNIYHHRLKQMDDLSLQMYSEILNKGSNNHELCCLQNLAELSGVVYQDTLGAISYYKQYISEIFHTQEQQRINTFIEFLNNPNIYGHIIRYANLSQPNTPDDWRYRIFWDGDVNAYEQLMAWAHKSSDICDFYECLYYSLIMAGKFKNPKAKVDLYEILSTMIHDDTPYDALVCKLLRLLK